MSDLDFDPELFGFWPKAPVYDGMGASEADAARQETARRLILDTKAEVFSPLDGLQDMLNEMTRELREQMQQFQRLRKAAEEKAALVEEEIDRKAIQADAKASIEAMSVIVRTLEKIDGLQRTIAHDRQAQADAAFDEEGYKAYIAQIDASIERRAIAIADERARRQAANAGCLDDDGADARAADTAQRTGAGPPHPLQGEDPFQKGERARSRS